MKNVLLVVVFVFIANFVFAATNSAEGEVEAKIISALTVTHTIDSNLNFGTLVSPEVAATVTIGADADTATYDNIQGINGNTVSRDSFTVSSSEDLSYSISFPTSTVTLVSGSNNMTVTNLTASCTSGCSSTNFNVGGTLNVGANQAAGTYRGTYQVTVTY